MKALLRSLAAVFTVAALAGGTASAQDKQALATQRDKESYMVGLDVGRSIAPVGPDLDMAAFERAIRNAFAGGKPMLDDTESKAVGNALMQSIAARNGQAGAKPAAPVAKDKVGLLVGSDVGRSLAPIKDELDLPVVLQGVRTVLDKGTPLLTDDEANVVREGFSARLQAKLQAQASAAAGKNKSEGDAFLAQNKTVKGVFTTKTGLQYMVLRQGAGPRPKPGERVRVNYQGTLLDGTVFDSSYERGQPIEFALEQVIPGWREGVSMMPVGGKYRFWLPGDLGYGPAGMPPSIGPNALLIFDVELLGTAAR